MKDDVQHFQVLTDTVFQLRGSGYRGVYRTCPIAQLFSTGENERAKKLCKLCRDRDDGTFPTIASARAALDAANTFGIACEIIECIIARDTVQGTHLRNMTGFLGYEVAEPYNYSAIVDRCMHFWESVTKDNSPVPPYTLCCVAEFFNARLNRHRLFDTYEDALYFLRVDRECAERFGGEMSCDPTIIAILSVE